MSEENDLTAIIIEGINDTIKPLDLVLSYILWKNGGEMEEKKLIKELDLFINFLTPDILEKMIDELIELGLISQDENGNIIKRETIN